MNILLTGDIGVLMNIIFVIAFVITSLIIAIFYKSIKKVNFIWKILLVIFLVIVVFIIVLKLFIYSIPTVSPLSH